MKKIWPHLIIVPLLLLIPVVTSPDFDGTSDIFRHSNFLRDLLRFVLAILFFYLNLYILLPRLFPKKKYWLYGSCAFACYWIIVLLPFVLVKPGRRPEMPGKNRNEIRFPMPPPGAGFQKMPRKNMPPPIPFDFSNRWNENLQMKMFMAFLPFMVALMSSMYIYKSIERKELEKAKARAELLSLKYQLHPHLLFNTLNSIYSLALTKSDEAPEAILRLSNVMRYVVQESLQDEVELGKELEYLQDYISLQLLRTGRKLDFSYEQNGDPDHLKIAPLILVNFVENAFKYGFNAQEKSSIHIHVNIDHDMLDFGVDNRIVNMKKDLQSLNVGLKNTGERLEQIYADRYQMTIENDGDIYSVKLKINLNPTT